MYINKRSFQEQFTSRIRAHCGKQLAEATDRDKFLALVSIVREYLAKNWIATRSRQQQQKQVWYLSIEFLPGRLLKSNLVNLGIRDLCAEGLAELGVNLTALEDQEEDPGIGNGGLGRLAACYLDSMAALGVAGHGYCLRYRYGLFEQKITNGYQQELPDNWLKEGSYAWEYRRPEDALEVRFGGKVTMKVNGKMRFTHEGYEAVKAVPYDIPIVGFLNNTVNTLRLWSAEPGVTEQLCFGNKYNCQLTDQLYPDDSTYEGKVLRLKQQYFLVSAGLQDILRNCRSGGDLYDLPNKVSVHINDTHPAMAIPEFMRLLMDERGLGWEEAWHITTGTVSYTNHTILPEALEKWPEEMFANLSPRLHMIVKEINERFCRDLWNIYPGDWDKIKSMAILADGQVHMANLAIVGSHSVNGVAPLHTEILKHTVMKSFHDIWPGKINNKTNGVTHRRWLMMCNPALAELVSEAIGQGWQREPSELISLLGCARDSSFLDRLAGVKQENKKRLAGFIQKKYGLAVDTEAIFDVHVKRLHAYKRQSMNVLHIMDLYNRLRDNPSLDIPPRLFIFGGKAAAGYYKAKKTIKLINTLAGMINHDKRVNDKLKVVFLENYNVSLAELIIPAADVSEQIPTASREASGTANMKFMMNGAITIGTMDGANVEIANAVGFDNIVTFGMSAEEVLRLYREGGYNPWDVYNSDARVRNVMEQLVNGFFPVESHEFRAHYDAFLNFGDQYFVLKDFASYVDAQNRIAGLFSDRRRWQNMVLHNIAHSGRFSSDRTFAEYAVDIWNLEPDVPVSLAGMDYADIAEVDFGQPLLV